jgi:hypothetical protein
MPDESYDFESPYFDWENDRMFDLPTRRLIDQIANDPRFNHSSASLEIVKELATEKGEDEQQGLLRSAWEVFELTVLPGLEARASELVARAVADPDFDALPRWYGESSVDTDNFSAAYTDPDPRVLEEFTRQLAESDVYQSKQEEAKARVESEAREIVSALPRRTRDLLVLATRNADCESLLDPWLQGLDQRRRGWTFYYAKRIVREDDEDSVFDRYSAAAKVLAGQSWSRKAIAGALGIGVGRVDRFLERTTGKDIAGDDPLCDLVPELRGRGEAWRHAMPARSDKPKPFSRLSAAEKLVLAEESSDPLLLERLAKHGTGQILELLISRHCLRGDVDDHVLQTILLTRPSAWIRQKMIEAHRLRPLPIDTALTLAEENPHVLLHCDEETAIAAKGLNREDFQAVLMVRESDINAIEGILRADSETESFRQLVGLLGERPLTEEMLDSTGLLNALLHAADQTDDVELAATLRLIACQSPEMLSQHVEAAKTGAPAAMSPATIVTVALGPYHLSGSNSRRGVMTGARALWEAADLTTEHSIAREVVAERGAEVVSLESVGNIYVATADAICSFRKSEAKEYTYVHMRFKSGAEFDLGNMVIQMPSALPALGYHREMKKSPVDPDGPEVEAIVWPIPFQPAIYALENGVAIGETGGLIAVSAGRVAIV